jgi:hypothetical protein
MSCKDDASSSSKRKLDSTLEFDSNRVFKHPLYSTEAHDTTKIENIGSTQGFVPIKSSVADQAINAIEVKFISKGGSLGKTGEAVSQTSQKTNSEPLENIAAGPVKAPETKSFEKEQRSNDIKSPVSLTKLPLAKEKSQKVDSLNSKGDLDELEDILEMRSAIATAGEIATIYKANSTDSPRTLHATLTNSIQQLIAASTDDGAKIST